MLFTLMAALAACNSDQGIQEITFDAVAVTTGDFDRVEEALDRNAVPSYQYEGYISLPVYDPDADPDAMTLKAETLFRGTNADGDPELFPYDALFVNSGTRGLGAWVYDGVDPDDDLVSDPAVIERLQEYTQRKRTVVVSDWGYDLLEAAFPDRVQFYNEADGLDAAQVGSSDTVVATVEDDQLAEALGNDQLELVFDFSYWTVMEDVASDVDVYLRGDVDVRLGDGQGYGRLEDVPLLVGYNEGGSRVIFSSFSWRAQRAQVTDILLTELVDGFDMTAQP